jgi:hypothetical protein
VPSRPGPVIELQEPSDEVRDTFAQEGVTHEQAYVINSTDGPLLIYVTEAADHRQASEAFRNSTLPIDIAHKAVMTEVLAGPPTSPRTTTSVDNPTTTKLLAQVEPNPVTTMGPNHLTRLRDE